MPCRINLPFSRLWFTIVLLTLVGFISGRPEMFLDLALAYALINFIATIAVLRYIETRARRQKAQDGGGA